MAGHARPIDQNPTLSGAATIYGTLAAAARARPSSAAFRDRGATTTYADLLRLADTDAARLRALDIAPGDRVVLWLPNGVRWASLFYACARLGAVTVPAGTRLRTLDLRHILRDSGARVLLYSPGFLGIDYQGMIDELQRELIAGLLPAHPAILAVGASARAGRTTLDSIIPAELPPACEDDTAPAIVCYTSGTTGRPKGCVHAHRSLVRNGAVAAGLIELAPGDRILCPVPFAHVFGFHMGVLQSALAGATLVNAEPYSAPRLLDLAENEQATVLYAVPTMAREALREQRARPRVLEDLRLTLVAGAPVTEQLRKAIVDPSEGLGSQVSIVYGCTEAPTITQLLPGDPPMPWLTSVGRPTPGVEVRICQTGRVTAVADGETGEILTRGYNQMHSYLGDPATTEAKHRGGWLVTGDLGWLDADGYLHFAGRASEMFLVGAFNAYPREIEGQLEQCVGVAEAAVLGVPDARLGSVPMAWLTPSRPELTEEEVLAWSRRNLADYKRPRYARVVQSLPRTASGKISRVKLDQLARRALPQLDWESADQ